MYQFISIWQLKHVTLRILLISSFYVEDVLLMCNTFLCVSALQQNEISMLQKLQF